MAVRYGVLAGGGTAPARPDDCYQPDLLLVPGGQGTRKEMHNPVLIDWITMVSVKTELVLSVCTGAAAGEGRASMPSAGEGHRRKDGLADGVPLERVAMNI